MDGQTRPPSEAPKVIKRYANRKLYRYVKLEEIGAMIESGREVQIIDDGTRGDLTAVTLAQIIFEGEKKRSRMPLEALPDIIRHGGVRIGEFVEREIAARLGELEGRIKHLEGEETSFTGGVDSH